MHRNAFWSAMVAFSALVILLLAIAPWRDRQEGRSRLDEAIRHVHIHLDWAMDHVTRRWNPFAKKVSSCTPFAAVRWRDSVPEVQVIGIWYELHSLDDVSAEEIVSFCKKTFGRIWRKRFEEDLVIVLMDMGKQGYCDSETGSLTVRRLDTGETLMLTDVAWTNANREAILRTALDVWIANGRDKDPREDLTVGPGR